MPTFLESLPASTAEFFVDLARIPFRQPPVVGDVGNAWFCAEASALAYKEPAFITELGKSLQPNWQTTVFEEGPTSAVLLRDQNVAVLAFRGTRVPAFPDLFRSLPINLQDLNADLTVLQTDHPRWGKVHRGFFNSFANFWKAHGSAIRAAVGDRALALTGHSLGGALATVAAAQLEGVQALYTFGSPRVGDAPFCQGLVHAGLPVYRFVHHFDLVTALPLEKMNYRHVGEMIHIAGEGFTLSRRHQHSLLGAVRRNLRASPANVRKFLAQMARLMAGNLAGVELPDDALVHHAPINYTQKLRAAALENRHLPGR